ncbi:hypothetical protein ACJJVG_08880 [Pseudocitrobacter faecalis]|uniref:hypothetical protein n=1 Tax=Pseudocitrobacter faecalis TaxID=1398493 RepID=UPI0038998431
MKRLSLLALVLLAAAGSAQSAELLSGKYSCTYPNIPALNADNYVLSVQENAHSHMLTLRATSNVAEYNFQTKQVSATYRRTTEPFYAVPFAPGKWQDQPEAGESPALYSFGENGKLDIYQGGEILQSCFEVD